jgi:hypothetical protein
MSNRRFAIAALALGLVSFVAGVIGALALADIARREPDVRAEWRALQVAAVAIVAFYAVAFAALRRLRNVNGRGHR